MDNETDDRMDNRMNGWKGSFHPDPLTPKEDDNRNRTDKHQGYYI
jgi:hypothetical protein